MPLYFAYGSNMDTGDLHKWCKKHNKNQILLEETRVAILRDYKLTFNYYSCSRKCGSANIMYSQGDVVYGLLSKISDEDLKNVSIKEGCPYHYGEIDIDVEQLDGSKFHPVKTYKVLKVNEKTTHQPPSNEYLSLIITNAVKNKFPDYYIDFLRSTKTK